LSENSKYIKVAQITSPHGIKGQVKIYLYSDPRQIKTYKNFYISEEYKKTLISLGNAKNNVMIATIDEIKDRNQAETYRKTNIYIKREDLVEIKDKDAYYVTDLIGISVIDKDKENIGKIKDVVDYGAGDIVIIELNDAKIVQYPFTDNIFPELDFEKNEIHFVEPEIC
jgi:16S rRNA processing protein RimM